MLADGGKAGLIGRLSLLAQVVLRGFGDLGSVGRHETFVAGPGNLASLAFKRLTGAPSTFDHAQLILDPLSKFGLAQLFLINRLGLRSIRASFSASETFRILMESSAASRVSRISSRCFWKARL